MTPKVMPLVAESRIVEPYGFTYAVTIPKEAAGKFAIALPNKEIAKQHIILLNPGVVDTTQKWVHFNFHITDTNTYSRGNAKNYKVGEAIVDLVVFSSEEEVEDYNQPDYDEV